jgi:hypothetical protein
MRVTKTSVSLEGKCTFRLWYKLHNNMQPNPFVRNIRLRCEWAMYTVGGSEFFLVQFWRPWFSAGNWQLYIEVNGKLKMRMRKLYLIQLEKGISYYKYTWMRLQLGLLRRKNNASCVTKEDFSLQI